jgi:hypothetical protein
MHHLIDRAEDLFGSFVAFAVPAFVTVALVAFTARLI